MYEDSELFIQVMVHSYLYIKQNLGWTVVPVFLLRLRTDGHQTFQVLRTIRCTGGWAFSISLQPRRERRKGFGQRSSANPSRVQKQLAIKPFHGHHAMPYSVTRGVAFGKFNTVNTTVQLILVLRIYTMLQLILSCIHWADKLVLEVVAQSQIRHSVGLA